MALPIEGFSVVAQLDRIQRFLDDGSVQPPNATALSDKHLWKCSFMGRADACKFLHTLEKVGLNVSQGPDSDVVIASEFDRSVEPYCEWLRTGVWYKAVIGWKEGTSPETVTAREGWDPKVGSGLELQDSSSMQFLEFLRLDGSVEVYLNKKTGQEVFFGRTSTPLGALYETAAAVIRKHLVTAGQPSLSGPAADEVLQAVAMLGRVLAEDPDWWAAQWFYGKGQLALGKYATAYTAFRRAFDLEKNVVMIPRELEGVCLELGRFDEAVQVGQAAVALEPADAGLLGNLAVAFLLAGQLVPARKTIDAATKCDPSDPINRRVAGILAEIEAGVREQPKSLRDLSASPVAKKPSWLKRLWK